MPGPGLSRGGFVGWHRAATIQSSRVGALRSAQARPTDRGLAMSADVRLHAVAKRNCAATHMEAIWWRECIRVQGAQGTRVCFLFFSEGLCSRWPCLPLYYAHTASPPACADLASDERQETAFVGKGKKLILSPFLSVFAPPSSVPFLSSCGVRLSANTHSIPFKSMALCLVRRHILSRKHSRE